MHSDVVESQWASAIIREVESLVKSEAPGVVQTFRPNNPRWNARTLFDAFMENEPGTTKRLNHEFIYFSNDSYGEYIYISAL